jgi:hypothetical protein
VKGERFVMIHFALASYASKDLCRNDTRTSNEEIDFAHIDFANSNSSDALMIAITDKIVFQAKTKMAYNGVDDEELFYMDFGGTGAPSTRECNGELAEYRHVVTIAASTMTNPGKWTSTSPSVYLAYDKVSKRDYLIVQGEIIEKYSTFCT